MLLLVAAVAYAQTAPDPDDVLDGARTKIRTTMRSLPKYTCLQTIDRTYYAPAAAHFEAASCDRMSADQKSRHKPLRIDSTDRVRQEVAQGVDGEIHSFPQASRFDLTEIDQMVDSGPFGTGTFGGQLLDIFDNDGTHYDYRGQKSREGRQVMVFGYVVAETVSHYEIRADGAWLTTGFSGTFEVDPESLEIQRVTIQTPELPDETHLCQADTTLDYQRVTIGDGTLLLPRQSQLRLISRNGQETNNTAVFSGCREYRAESALRFDTPTAERETPTAPGNVRPPVPPKLAVDLRLNTAIDTETSAAGDPVSATVVHAIHSYQSAETLIPAGAVVHGRISRIEHHFSPMEYLSIGIAFESVEFDGGPSPFAARTEPPAHFYGTVPVDLLRGLAQRIPTPPPDSVVFPKEKHHVMAAGTVLHWITASPGAAN
jgi:hypothetical protein